MRVLVERGQPTSGSTSSNSSVSGGAQPVDTIALLKSYAQVSLNLRRVIMLHR